MTWALASSFVRFKFLVADLDQSSPYDFPGYLVTVATAGIGNGAFVVTAFRRMADVTDLRIDLEMLVAFETTVAGAARKFYSVYNFRDMSLVRKLQTVIVYLFGQELFTAVTVGPQARNILDAGIGLGRHPTQEIIDRMSGGGYFAFHIIDETRLEVAFYATDVVVS
jgi:hypothetical protein